MHKKKTLIDIFVTFLCLLVAYWIHIHTFINWDVAWHVEGARRLLLGGSYLVNVFDNNSPFVFAYYFPVIWLHKFLAVQYPNLIVTYMLLTAIIPLLLTYTIINKIFAKKEIFVKTFLYYITLFVIVFLPAFNLGHREMILIYFFLPYFLILVFSTTNPAATSFGKTLSTIAVVLAAFGIAQNYFYLSIPIFLDIYRYIKTKKFTIYQFSFYCCIFISVITIAILYPEYIKHIIPMVLCYERGFNFPILVLLLEALTFISLLTIIIVLINFKRLHKSNDIVMAFIAATASLVIYFLELKLWYYHLYPALSFIVLILALIIIKYYEETLLGFTIQPKINLFSAALSSGILVTIFIIMVGYAIDELIIYHDPNYEMNRWLVYSQQHFRDKKLFFFVIKMGFAYSLPLYSQANIEIVSPWSNPWLLPYIILNKNNNCHRELQSDIGIFRKLAASAIAHTKPDFLIIEATPKTLLPTGKKFHYLDFFAEEKGLANLFKDYSYYGYFDKLTIYKRTDVNQ